jgi:hypothetical protein
MLHFTHSAKPLVTEELDAFERHFGFVFPREIREFYLRTNGGKPSRATFVDERGPCKLHSVLPIKYVAIQGLSTMDQSIKHLKIQSKLLPDALIPFGVDPLGSYFCFSTDKTAEGSMWLVYMDGAATPELLSPSLKDFLARLR